MFNPLVVVIVMLIYFGLLFLLALWVESRSPLSKRIAGNPFVYGLSLAVFATSWTYYGSVGKAVSSGMLFTTIYIGPTLTIILWWQIMRRMVRIKNKFHITSIADFISARYDRSLSLAAMASCAALVGSTPYLALQIKSVVATFNTIAGDPGPTTSWVREQVGPLSIILMIGFTIMIGVRKLDPTERHPGMITVVAVESIVKLAAFLACGIFITFVAHNGFRDVFANAEAMGLHLNEIISLTGPVETPYSTWATYLVLSMSAIMFLPRQFHVAVIENSDQRHLTTAMWLFPLYMLLISIFVVPIALEGLRIGFSPDMADTFVLKLPMWYSRPWLTMLVYIGGVSAAISMVMISSMTLSTMLTNHILLPIIGNFKQLMFLRRHLIRLRWFCVALVILTGYWFEVAVGNSFMLVNMGLISFAAALQFAPPILGGLFWEQGNKIGAQLALAGGYTIWFYTLVVPAFARSDWAFQSMTLNGPFGIELLKPEALFGLTSMDPLGQSVFWSMFVNIGLYVSGSMACTQSATGMTLAKGFVNILQREDKRAIASSEASIDLEEKTHSIVAALTRYMDDSEAGALFVKSVRRAGLAEQRMISLADLAELLGEVENALAGAVGTAEAHAAIMSANVYTEKERDKLSSMYAEILAELKLSPGELKQRVDYYMEREALLSSQAEDLERRVRERTMELKAANTELESFSYSVSHDLRAPLRAIDGFSQALIEDYGDKLEQEALNYLDRVRLASQRMGMLIDDILALTHMSRLGVTCETVDLGEIMLDVILEIREHDPDTIVEIEIEPDLKTRADPHLVRLLMTNLVGNAWKFSSANEHPKVTFKAKTIDGTKWFVLRDNGAGFDMRYADKLFQAFSRLHTQDEFEGTGIGLAIVDRVIRKHGGQIRAEGEIGKGATFSFTL
ncbi:MULTISPECIES: ATP-binding protein [unclassified Pseudodesulfovibrio]|uniref:ATP-binding protein n=1 Tax=unclassified Pseudodesulfovibrio TaxID=2661612 RepID=UPI0019D4A403|nr:MULTISPECIES: ATP-binding protein [unclassified Pseudodesulfovibrio]MCJ2165518.1 ATP-binding protein [Pseudodesulfovibrio sp. S3-i]